MTHKIEVPESVLYPKASEEKVESQPVKHIEKKNRTVVLRPLTINQIAVVAKASKDDRSLLPALMIHESLVEPKLSLEQIRQMHFGLASFLISKINKISGMEVSENF